MKVGGGGAIFGDEERPRFGGVVLLFVVVVVVVSWLGLGRGGGQHFPTAESREEAPEPSASGRQSPSTALLRRHQEMRSSLVLSLSLSLFLSFFSSGSMALGRPKEPAKPQRATDGLLPEFFFFSSIFSLFFVSSFKSLRWVCVCVVASPFFLGVCFHFDVDEPIWRSVAADE